MSESNLDKFLQQLPNNQEAIETIAPERSLFEKLQKGFSLTGSVTREALQGGTKGEFGDIIGGEKRVTPREFIDFVGEKFGADLHFGKKGDTTTSQDVANFISELGVDILTDPIGNALFAIPGRTVKGMQKLGFMSKLGKTEEAFLRQAVGRGVGGGVAGGIVGLSARKEGEEDLKDIIVDTAGGVVLGALAPSVVSLAKAGAPKLNDFLVEGYLKMTRPKFTREVLRKTKFNKDSITELSKKFRSFNTNPELNNLKRDFFESKAGILRQLQEAGGDNLVNRFVEITDEAFDMTMQRRNQSINRRLKAMRKVDPDAKIKDIDDVFWDNALNRSNTFVGSYVADKIREMPFGYKLKGALDDYVANNRRLVDRWNNVAKRKGIAPITVPIDYHTTDLIDPTDVKDIYRQIVDVETGFKRRVSENVKIGRDVTPLIREKIGSERFIGRLADKAEGEARSIMAKMLAAPVEGSAAKKGLFEVFESGLEAYDSFMNIIKTLHLTFTHSWLQNNYVDNTVRAFIASDSANFAAKAALGTNPFTALSKHTTMGEMLRTLHPVKDIKSFKALPSEIGIAQDLGVVSDDFFRDLDFIGRENLGELIAKVGKNRAQTIMNKMRNRNHFIRGARKPFEILNETVGRLGSASENTSRMLSFRHFYKTYLDDAPKAKNLVNNLGLEEAFKQSPEVQSVLQKAAKSVNDTFFDYGNLLEIEKSVMKRLFPYWTFFSRNFDFWSKEFAENTGSINKVLKLQANSGKELTPEERMGVPEWLLKMGARKGEDTPDGMTVVTLPNLSVKDAISLAESFGEGNVGEEALNKYSPPIKTLIEQWRGREFFIDQPLSVEEGVKKGRRVFSQGLPTGKALNAVYEYLGQEPPVEIKKGKASTKSELAARLINLQSNLLPLPLVSSILQVRENVNAGKELSDELLKKTPVVKRTLSKESLSRTKKFRENKRKRDKKRREGK